jgi:hypothetical protein
MYGQMRELYEKLAVNSWRNRKDELERRNGKQRAKRGEDSSVRNLWMRSRTL